MPRQRKVLGLGLSAAAIFAVLAWGADIYPLASPAPQAEAAQSRPSWLHTMPIVLVGNWDSMPIFRRRVGGNPTWQEEDYEKEHTEEAVDKLKELGVTMIIVHFFKGFGLEAEREHREKAMQLAALAKKKGLKVGVYVGSTIAYESFLLEKPEAEDWFIPDYLGKPVFYGNQTFRKRVYFMHPGYREYMRQVLRTAQDDFHADLIHFDNIANLAEPPMFQHPLAIEQFREFLRNKYTAEELKQRLGFSDVRYVVPPRYDRPLDAINDPLFQEWADFRCEMLTRFYAEMEALLRQQNPDVAVEVNPSRGISGINTIWDESVDYPRLLSHLDAVWTEEGDPASVTDQGVLVSRIRTFKMSNTLHNTLFVATAGERGNPLQMAEALAFGRQCIGDVGGVLAGYDMPQDQRRYIKFFHHNFDYYRDIDNVADVAVLHSYATMGFNNDRPAVSTMLFEQALIQGRVPFDIIFDANLKDLSKYRVLALPDQECLSDEQMNLIRQFVHRGGGLVVTEHTSLFTPWRQRRREFGLKDLLNVDAPPYHGPLAAESILKIPPVHNQIGSGRVVYIPEVKPTIEKPQAVPMSSEYWKLPANWRELNESVKWAAGGQLSLEVVAPAPVVAELTEQKQNKTLIVHLLNYNVVRTPEVSGIQVSLRMADHQKVRKAFLLSPEEEGQRPLVVTEKDGRATISVPPLRTYALAVIQSE
jgi:hypothetical protein